VITDFNLNACSFGGRSVTLGHAVDRAQYLGSARFQRFAHAFFFSDRTHLALALDGGFDHQWIEPQFAQCSGGLFHFRGSPFAVACHALEIVIGDLRPIERRIIVLQRDGNFLQYSGTRSGEELQGMVAEMLATPPAILAQVAQAIQIKSAEAARSVKPGAAE